MLAFEIAESEPRRNWRVLTPVGELDLNEASKLDEALGRAADCDVVLVDLRKCEFMDSTGIAVLVRAHRAMAEKGKSLPLCGATSQVLRVLSISGLTRDGFYFGDLPEAMAAIERSSARG